VLTDNLHVGNGIAPSSVVPARKSVGFQDERHDIVPGGLAEELWVLFGMLVLTNSIRSPTVFWANLFQNGSPGSGAPPAAASTCRVGFRLIGGIRAESEGEVIRLVAQSAGIGNCPKDHQCFDTSPIDTPCETANGPGLVFPAAR